MDISAMDLPSKHTGRTHRVQVFTPRLPAPPTGYPVMFVTDGNGFFNLVADQMRVREYTDLTPAVIVGIGYPTDDLFAVVRLRMRDLIFEAPNAAFMPTFAQWAQTCGATAADAGGADGFHRFIVDELRPLLAGRLPIDAAQQVLVGHSLGGLFALHVLFNHPAAFSTCVASSPSILYNGGAVKAGLAGFQAAVERGEVQPRILLLVGGLETYPSLAQLAAMPADEALHQIQHAGTAVDHTLAMAARLKAIRGGAGYEVQAHVFDGENHMSVVPASLSRALTFAFSTMPPA
jgi:predicted alpha/beta superfamily hydrolase